MEDDTTTTPDVQAETGAEEAQPVEQNVPEVAAESPDSEPSEAQQDDQAEESAEAAPEVDDKLQKYAKSQGLELDSPSAIKAATIAMKAQSEATKNYQKANELEKASNIAPDQVVPDATPEQKDNVRLRNMEMRLEARAWKDSNPDKVAYEPQMAEILVNDPTKRTLLQEGYLSYDDIYAIAKGNSPDNSNAVKSQGGREALQTLAHKQAAAVPKGHATNPSATPPKKKFEDMSIKEMEAHLGKVRQ